MPCVPFPGPGGGTISIGGPIYAIVVGGKMWHFELPHGCSLCVCSKSGDERKEPPAKHYFWKAVELWQTQGGKVVDGVCVYDPDLEMLDTLRHIGGRNYEVIGRETVGDRRKRLEAK